MAWQNSRREQLFVSMEDKITRIMNMNKLSIIVVSALLLTGCSASQTVNIQPTNNADNQEISKSNY